ISLSPTSGMAPEPKTPAAILAGAAQEVAKSTRASDPIVAKSASGPMAGGNGHDGESLSEQARDTVSFGPESMPKVDLDFNLAKAYQEMGDVEGAREILQEVLHEGDDQQKSEAQGMLSKLT